MLSAVRKHHAEIIVGFRMIFLDGQGAAIAGLRLLDVVEVTKRVAEISESARISGVDCDRPAIFGQRSGVGATLMQQQPEIIMRFSDRKSAGDYRAV